MMNVTVLENETEQLLIRQPGAPLLAAQYVRRGQLVVFPTDTVYGIGADAFHEEAIKGIYQVKERPVDKGIPILLADVPHLNLVIAGGMAALPPAVLAMIKEFWPGPLTLVLPKAPGLPASISTTATVAVRLLDHDLSRAFIRAVGGAVAATSANRSGAPPARTAAEAMHYFRGQVALVLDGGLSPKMVASTIVDGTISPMRLLREGPIPLERLEMVAGQPIVDDSNHS